MSSTYCCRILLVLGTLGTPRNSSDSRGDVSIPISNNRNYGHEDISPFHQWDITGTASFFCYGDQSQSTTEEGNAPPAYCPNGLPHPLCCPQQNIRCSPPPPPLPTSRCSPTRKPPWSRCGSFVFASAKKVVKLSENFNEVVLQRSYVMVLVLHRFTLQWKIQDVFEGGPLPRPFFNHHISRAVLFL